MLYISYPIQLLKNLAFDYIGQNVIHLVCFIHTKPIVHTIHGSKLDSKRFHLIC